MSQIYGRPSRRRRLARSLRAHTRWWVLIIVGVLMVIGAGSAFAAIQLRGQGTLVVAAAGVRDLGTGNIRLVAPLLPGGTADVSVAVHNPNTFPVRVERAALLGAPSRVNPAGCFAKISGPLTVKAGYTLRPAERVTIGPGQTKTVVLHQVLKLAAAAKAGCGFRIELEIGATQQPPTIPPTSPGSGSSTPPQEPPTDPQQPPSEQPSTPAPSSSEPGNSAPPPLGGEEDDEPLPGGAGG